MSKQTALDVVRDGLMAAFSEADIQETAEAVAEAMGGHQMTPRDLERIGMPAGRSRAFLLDDGNDQKQEIHAAVLLDNDIRLMFAKPFGSGPKEPPQCYSTDGKNGIGQPGGLCETCEWNQWGTRKNEHGEPTRGKACSERRLFVLFTPDSTLPLTLSAPPSSLNTVRKDFMRAAGKGHKPSKSLWTFYLETSAAGGVEHPVVRARFERELSEEELAMIGMYRQAIGGIKDELVQASGV